MSQLKQLVNNKPLWDSFLEELNNEIETSRRGLEQASELQKVFQYQGQVQAYNRLKKLRDKVNNDG